MRLFTGLLTVQALLRSTTIADSKRLIRSQPTPNSLARRVLFMLVQHGALRSPPNSNTEVQTRITMKMKLNSGSLTVLLVAASMALPAVAQSTSDQQQPQVQTGASTNAQAQPQTTEQTGTGKAPLPMQSNEGFWGKVNPFARKKWVQSAARSGQGSPERTRSAPGQERQRH